MHMLSLDADKDMKFKFKNKKQNKKNIRLKLYKGTRDPMLKLEPIGLKEKSP